MSLSGYLSNGTSNHDVIQRDSTLPGVDFVQVPAARFKGQWKNHNGRIPEGVLIQPHLSNEKSLGLYIGDEILHSYTWNT